jgi:hypothetical protein
MSLRDLHSFGRAALLVMLTGCHMGPPIDSTAPAAMGAPGAPLIVATPVIELPPESTCGPPIYLAPGEPCYAPGFEFVPPVATAPLGAPLFDAPTAPAIEAAPLGAATPGLWEVLPPDGGALSPEFGLPAAATVGDALPNPLTVPVGDPDFTWDQLAEVVSRYFPIQREQRVQQFGAVVSEGRIETPFQIAATVFEPQRRDSVGAFNLWQSTLQTIRRRAVLRVIPLGNAYQLDLQVQKQLEDLPDRRAPRRAPPPSGTTRHCRAIDSIRSIACGSPDAGLKSVGTSHWSRRCCGRCRSGSPRVKATAAGRDSGIPGALLAPRGQPKLESAKPSRLASTALPAMAPGPPQPHASPPRGV